MHEVHDWLYVLDGRLGLVLGDEDFTIKPGEAVELTTWTPHWFGAVDGPVELIGSFGPQGRSRTSTAEIAPPTAAALRC